MHRTPVGPGTPEGPRDESRGPSGAWPSAGQGCAGLTTWRVMSVPFSFVTVALTPTPATVTEFIGLSVEEYASGLLSSNVAIGAREVALLHAARVSMVVLPL